MRRPAAVVHVTDDILLFAQAALEDPSPPVRPAKHVDGAIIEDACWWWEVEVAGDRRAGAASLRDGDGRLMRARA